MKFAAFLDAHARTTPAKDAVVCGNARISFAELDESTDRLAQSLRAIGISVGERVAIYLPNGVEFVRAFISVVKAGAIAVPINTRLAPGEIAYILGDCEPRAVFIAGETREALNRSGLNEAGIALIASDSVQSGEHSMDALIAAGTPETPDVPFAFDDCMICYTSGTTGKPKGAILTQSNYIVLNGFLNAIQWGLTSADRHLVTTPLAHRTGFARVANLICHGGTLFILPRFDAQEVSRIVREERITVLGMVPTVGRMMLDEFENAPESFSTLQTILVTGEAFPLDVKERLHRALPHVRLYSFFAMTEVGGLTSLGPEEQFTHPASVGRVNPGIELRLMDSGGGEVAPGEVGEMWVRTGEPGRFLTLRGYFGKPMETAEAIRDGWVATGDLARMDSDGYLYIMDRKKDMVLSGGYNIYCKEVELALIDHPAVLDAAVVGVPDPVFGEAVAAYVELKPGASATEFEIVAYCKDRVASYKKPKYVRFVAELPRNSMGKVMKSDLRKEFATSPSR